MPSGSSVGVTTAASYDERPDKDEADVDSIEINHVNGSKRV
jgi:hypothetical protein